MACFISVILKGEQQVPAIRGTKTRDEYYEAIKNALTSPGNRNTITITDEDGDYHMFVVDSIKGVVIQQLEG